MSDREMYCDREYGESSEIPSKYKFTVEFYTSIKDELQKVFDAHYKKFLEVFKDLEIVLSNPKEELIPLMFVVSQISLAYTKYDYIDADTNLLLDIFFDWIDKLNFKNDIQKINSERFHLYTDIIHNDTIPRYEWLMFRTPEDNSNLILRCCAAFGDILINPDCAKDYYNAPVIMHDVFQVREFSLKILKFQYFIKEFHDEIIAFFNNFHKIYHLFPSNIKVNDREFPQKSVPYNVYEKSQINLYQAAKKDETCNKSDTPSFKKDCSVMSLINCPECKREVSNKADICPQCGFPISKMRKLNKRKNDLLIIKKYILNCFSKSSIQFKKMLDSKVFMYLVFLPIILCIFFIVLLLGMWLLEKLLEFNAIIGLFTLILGANIIGWFASYKWGAKKYFFWLVFIVTIAFFSMCFTFV